MIVPRQRLRYNRAPHHYVVGNMIVENSKLDRRSTRLTIGIPVVISGVDAKGQTYHETVRTVTINKHGGKIATTHDLAMGAEVLLENHAVGLTARASVVWLGENASSGVLHHVALQLLEAQNIWGIIFPPDDWVGELPTERPAEPGPAADVEGNVIPAKPAITAAARDQVSNAAVRELQAAADACADDFEERLKQLTQQLGMELEFDLRARAFIARDREVGGMGEQIRLLQETLNVTKQEVAKLESQVRQLKSELQSPAKAPHLIPGKEAHRQLTALSKAIIEKMNRAAQEGLREYRSLLQKENEESSAKLLANTEDRPAAPITSSSKQ